MNRFICRGFFIFSGVLLLGGCSKKSEGPVVARVGSEEISAADFAILMQDPAYRQYAASSEGQKQFLNLLVREKIILVEAKRAGLQKEDAYQKALEDYRKRSERRVQDFGNSLLVESYLRKLRSGDLGVPDAEVQKFYDQNKAEFEHPVEIAASHILAGSESEAKKALDLVKGGEPFEQVAKAMSKDPATAERGGQLKPFKRGTLLPEFEEVVFNMKPGEIAGPVKSQLGFHIIKKTGEKALPKQSFDQVKEEVRARLERQKFDEWVTKKQASIGVKIDPEAVAAAGQALSAVQETP